MGPNGSGKVPFLQLWAKREEYEASGEIIFNGEDLLELAPEDRAHKGVFMSFQYPVEIPGISVSNFIKTSISESRKAIGLPPLPTKDLLRMMRDKNGIIKHKSRVSF